MCNTANEIAGVPVAPQTDQMWEPLAKAASEKHPKAVNQGMATFHPRSEINEKERELLQWRRRFIPRGITKFPKPQFLCEPNVFFF